MKNRPVWQRAQRKLRRMWLVGSKAAVQAWRGRVRGVRPRLHVFIAGAQRSGTNMVTGLLERSHDTAVFHERDRRAFDHYLMREPRVIERLVAKSPAPVFVIKALCEMDRLPELMDHFSPARTIWVVRHYDDAVNSSLQSFSHVAEKIPALIENPEAHGWMGRGMGQETRDELARLDHPAMNDASRVALFWYLRNRLLFDLALHRDGHVLPIRYETLVANPRMELDRLFASMDIEAPARLAGLVSRNSVRRSDPPEIEAPVRAACDALLNRLDEVIVAQRATWKCP